VLKRLLVALSPFGVAMAVASVPAHAQADPLASWIDGAAKARIVAFVKAATEPGGKDFVPAADRIAVFDNDGTLWSEQPMYFQLAFAMDRVKALAPQHPEWKTRQPFKAVLEGDMKTLAASGEHGLVELVMASHAGNTTDEFAQVVRDWMKNARHPRSNRLYTELTYRPMRELLDYSRANGFATYIVSGGGVEFLRVVSEELYGVPPQQVIGSSVQTKYALRDSTPVIVRLPGLDFIDDKAGKPVGIHKFIGKLDRGLDEAGKRGWLVVSMKNDWRRVYTPAR
jgi:phosphoglycolate phosphatase-like HAD superfamily hydrolase